VGGIGTGCGGPHYAVPTGRLARGEASGQTPDHTGEPRLSKPLELKKRPRPRRRSLQRTMVCVKARADRQRAELAFEPTWALNRLVRPRVTVSRVASIQEGDFESRVAAQMLEVNKEARNIVDTSLEMLDIQSLDTGRYHALVVQDPSDRRNIQGFCRLAVVYSEAMSGKIYGGTGQTYFERYIMPVVLNLADAMNRHTKIRTGIFGRITLDDAELFKTPWVYFMAFYNFQLPDSELAGLGKYLTCGGFVFADTHSPPHYSGGFHGVVGSIKGAFEAVGMKEVTFHRLPEIHPIYHCYFDFQGPPLAFGSEVGINYLEGIEVNGHLSVILSRKSFYSPWKDWGKTPWGSKGGSYVNWDPERALQFAVNLIVFALTQEGSITHRLMDSIR